MRKFLKRFRNEEGGFTLVEMLVVISIIGVLASVSVVAIGGMSGESRKSACNGDVAAAQAAADSYAAQHAGTFPATIAAMYTSNLLRGTAPDLTADGYALQIDATTGKVTTVATSSCTIA
jgi:prepilin-type N-terminal cleavage/methylation domain-containing protein